MTINAAFTKDQQVASSGDTTFSIPFQFDLETDLRVYLTPNGEIPNDISNLLSLGNDYTVTGAGWGQVSRFVTLVTPANLGDVLTFTRDMPIGRSVDFTLGEFTSLDINNQFDSIIGMIQQVNTEIVKLGLTYNQTEVLKSSGSQNTFPKLPPNTGAGIPIITANSAGDIVAGSIVEGSDATTLRSELVNDQSGTDGARIVGYENISATPDNTTVHDALDELYSRPSNNDIQTGDMILSFKTSAPVGWLLYDDGWLGSSLATVPTSPIVRNTHFGPEFEGLYTAIWNNVDDANAPVVGGRGASAAADFASNKAMRMPLLAGRSLGASGVPQEDYNFTTDFATSNFIINCPNNNIQNGMTCSLISTGTLPTGLSPSLTYVLSVRANPDEVLLSETPIDYSIGNPANPTLTYPPLNLPAYAQFSDNGTDVHSIILEHSPKFTGDSLGFDTHILRSEELARHQHNQLGASAINPSGFISEFNPTVPELVNVQKLTEFTGESEPFNIQSVSSFVKVFIKL
jgi:hypothetical protein